MTKKLYDYLNHTFRDSVTRELQEIEDVYPLLANDIRKWTYRGKTMSGYELLRQQYVAKIKQTKEANQKQALRIKAIDELLKAGKWYAFQFLFEEAYRERFANEVVINMLHAEKYSLEDIELILPYLSEEKITKIILDLADGADEWEVITSEQK